jgi:hypothetical protein
MILTETSMLDDSTLNARKILFAEDIIEYFIPLFREEIDRKKQQFEQSGADYKELRAKISDSKETVKKIQQEYGRQKLIKQILSLVESSLTKELAYGRTRFRIREIVEKLDVSNNEQLKEYRSVLLKLVNRNVQKVVNL